MHFKSANAQETTSTFDDIKCYSFGGLGHWASVCANNRKPHARQDEVTVESFTIQTT